MQKIPRKDLKLIVYDFDGVLTNNMVILSQDGKESVIVHRADGLAISKIKELGIPQLILTTETNEVVERRARKLGIPLIKGVQNKQKALVDYCQQNHISFDNVLYIGNDINDLEAMKKVRYSLCPSDAYEEVKSVAGRVLNSPGGNGVVRELINHLQ